MPAATEPMFQPTSKAEFSPPSQGTVFRLAGGRVVSERLRFGFEPVGAEERAQLNVRSEGRSFPVERRCLVPVSEFYIPARYRPAERRARFTMPGQLFCFAAVWRPASLNWPESYATLTVESGPDAAPFGERQMVVVREADWMDWLCGSCPEAELLVPPPAGTFAVEEVGRPAPALADLLDL
jgi:putative SOS response-associated peptidase YedK